MASNRLTRHREGFVSEDREIKTCDMCNSKEIKKTIEGYVCGQCGVVLSSLILEYHHPYDDLKLHHAPRGKTQMGSYRERIRNTRSAHLTKLSKLDSERKGKERVEVAAQYEIRRILSGLGLSLSEVEPVFKLFCKIRKCLKAGTKYRSVQKLVPITIYLYFKLNCMEIRQQDLLEISDISKREFNSFKLQLKNYIPYYYSRDRKKYILQKIMNITATFDQGMEFYHAAENVLEKLWSIIKNTKDDVIASLCTSIVALCDTNQELKVSAICNHVGIQMSTIHRQVEQKIFQRLQIEGFESLVRSSDLLRKVMIKLGVIDLDEEEPIPISLIKVKLGRAVDVFNAHKSRAYYLYAIKTTSGSFMLVEEEPQIRIQNNDFTPSNQIEVDGVMGKRKFSIEFSKYDYPRGPPELAAIL